MPQPPALQTPPRPGRLRPDLSTLAGISLSFAGIIGGLILEKGSIQDIAQTTAALIVLGGTFGAVLVTTPLDVVLRAVRSVGSLFLERSDAVPETIEHMIHYATKARRNGIVSLEAEAAAVPDPFFRKALNLAVDGTDLQEIRRMMELQITLDEQSAEAEAKVWESAGGYAPTVGIIGAVMGLMQVMKHLEDIREVGHGIAVAFVATVYGVGSANILFLPAASKLRARIREASLLKEMMLEGVSAIVSGLNPALIRLKLDAFRQGRSLTPDGASGRRRVPAPVGAPAEGRP